MIFETTKGKVEKNVIFEKQRFYCSKTYSFGMVVPQKELANANEATTRDLTKKKLVEATQGRTLNNQGERKIGPKGQRKERFRSLTGRLWVSKCPWGGRGGYIPTLKERRMLRI